MSEEEFTFLKWFFDNSDFGPADQEVREEMYDD